MDTILMMLVKLATPGLLKMKAFLKKCYGVIISVVDVINTIYLMNQIIF